MRLNKLEYALDGPCILTGARAGAMYGDNRPMDRQDDRQTQPRTLPSSNFIAG